MLNALIFISFLTGAASGDDFRCLFPGTETSEKPIEVTVRPHPSLKDRPGLFRVTMDLNGLVEVKAHAQPVNGEADVLIQGRLGPTATYTLGLRTDGLAALNLKTATAGAEPRNRLTRAGECRGFRTIIDRWLP